jgi:hypothetical protein
LEETRAVYLPCAQCGAALPVELDEENVSCGFCGGDQSLAGEAIERLRAHLSELAALEWSMRLNRSETESYRKFSRPGWSLAVGVLLNAVMVGAGWSGVLLNEWLVPRVGPTLAKVILIPLGVVAFLAISIGWIVILSGRSPSPAPFPQVTVARARCGSCGASLPVKLGVLPRCLFCQAELIPDPVAATFAEAEAQRFAKQAAEEAQSERQRYQEKLERGLSRGQIIGWIWGGLCFGAMAGMLATSLTAFALTRQDPFQDSGMIPMVGAMGGALLGAAFGYRLARRKQSKRLD